MVDASSSGNDFIVFDTIRRFKGLDRPAVILVDADHVVETELAYVGLSRARVFLAIIGSKQDLDRLRQGA